MSETVIVERANGDDNIVTVIGYDIENQMVTEGFIDTMPKEEAQDMFNIIGEVIDGEIMIYGEDIEEEDFSEVFEGDYYEE